MVVGGLRGVHGVQDRGTRQLAIPTRHVEDPGRRGKATSDVEKEGLREVAGARRGNPRVGVRVEVPAIDDGFGHCSSVFLGTPRGLGSNSWIRVTGR